MTAPRRNTMNDRLTCNVAAEKAVLGALLADPRAYAEVGPILADADFYDPKHRQVYRAVTSLEERGERVDILTLSGELARHGWLDAIGGEAYLRELTGSVPSASSAGQYARLVREAATRRNLPSAADEVRRAAVDPSLSVDDAVGMAESAALSVRRTGGTAADIRPLMERLYDRVADWQNNPLADGETRGLATGIRPLDEGLGGLEPGLYLVAARSSMGKTALVLQCVSNIAERGQKVIFFSLEMSAEQIGLRLACSHAEVELDRIKRGVATPEEHGRVVNSIGMMSEWPLIIHTGSFRAGDVRAVVQREQRRGEVAAVFVDGLWLMAASKDVENRHLELGSISRVSSDN
jgi:replicative DNA helicase